VGFFIVAMVAASAALGKREHYVALHAEKSG
jgi:hypothetical protein